MTERADDYMAGEAPREKRNAVPRDIVARYKLTFQSQVGTYVLASQLLNLGLFETISGNDDVVRHNAAIELLGFVGIIRPIDEHGNLSQVDMEKIVDALFGIKE